MQQTAFRHSRNNLPQLRLLHAVPRQGKRHAREHNLLQIAAAIRIGRRRRRCPERLQFLLADVGEDGRCAFCDRGHPLFEGVVVSTELFFLQERRALGDVFFDPGLGHLGCVFAEEDRSLLCDVVLIAGRATRSFVAGQSIVFPCPGGGCNVGMRTLGPRLQGVYNRQKLKI